LAAAAAYDLARRRAVVFGGLAGASNFAGTLELVDGAWAAPGPVSSPPSRAFASAAYDEVDREVVMFGGVGSNGPIAETWMFAAPDLSAAAIWTPGPLGPP